MHLLFFSCCFTLLLILSDASVIEKFLSEIKNNSADGTIPDIWALLVAGSAGWDNYRHQVNYLKV